ncbi:hypothetical protein I7I48_11174 [Histoplasma ohiense]|nr:hypothetical protein I7I48_11174 [Histoplasma ohiense (nom. inval.)]
MKTSSIIYTYLCIHRCPVRLSRYRLLEHQNSNIHNIPRLYQSMAQYLTQRFLTPGVLNDSFICQSPTRVLRERERDYLALTACDLAICWREN